MKPNMNQIQFDLTIESVLPSQVMAAPRNMKMAVIVMKTVWHAYELHVKIFRTCKSKTNFIRILIRIQKQKRNELN